MMLWGEDVVRPSLYYVTPRKRVETAAANPEADDEVESKNIAPTAKKETTLAELRLQVMNQAKSIHRVSSLPVHVASDISDDMYEELMNNLDSDAQWKSCRCKMALLYGNIVITKLPSEIHDMISRWVVEEFSIYSFQNQRIIDSLGSTRVRYGQANSCLEGDESFVNNRAQFSLDHHHNVIPAIIIEVASSETYESVQSTAMEYLFNENVRLVISIIVLTYEHQAVQLYCIVHEKNTENQVIVSQVISFGRTCHHQTVRAIQRHTGVADVRFTGMGRNRQIPEGEAYFNALSDVEFSVLIPQAAIWWNVPEDRRFEAPPCSLELRSIVEKLRRYGYT